MNLEEINEIEDKAERLGLLKQYVEEALVRRDQRQDQDHSYDEGSMREERGGMMSTAAGKSDRTS